MMALISLSLGVTNLLPIPALDGGKLLILLIEAIRRKPLKQETEINIQLIGFSILIGLSLLVTYNDILRIFWDKRDRANLSHFLCSKISKIVEKQ